MDKHSCSDDMMEASFELQALHVEHVALDDDQPHGCFSRQTWQAFPTPLARKTCGGKVDSPMALTVPSCSADQASAREALLRPVFTSPSPPATGLALSSMGHGFPGNPGGLPCRTRAAFSQQRALLPPHGQHSMSSYCTEMSSAGLQLHHEAGEEKACHLMCPDP